MLSKKQFHYQNVKKLVLEYSRFYSRTSEKHIESEYNKNVRFENRKNLDRLFQAFYNYIQINNNISLVITGNLKNKSHGYGTVGIIGYPGTQAMHTRAHRELSSDSPSKSEPIPDGPSSCCVKCRG